MDRYIKLPRALYESSAWKSATGEQVKAFLDLCFYVAYSEHNYQTEKFTFELHPGQIVTSQSELMKRWNMQRGQVRGILRFFENNNFIRTSIVTNLTNHYTLLTINMLEKDEEENLTNELTNIQKKGLNNLSKDKSRGRERAREGKPSQPFPPSVQEIQSYLDEKLITDFTAQEFYDYYDTVGWVVGKNKPMKSWQGAVRTWVTKRKKESNQYGNSNSQPNTDRQADATIRQQQFEQHIISRLTGASTVPKPKLPF